MCSLEEFIHSFFLIYLKSRVKERRPNILQFTFQIAARAWLVQAWARSSIWVSQVIDRSLSTGAIFCCLFVVLQSWISTARGSSKPPCPSPASRRIHRSVSLSELSSPNHLTWMWLCSVYLLCLTSLSIMSFRSIHSVMWIRFSSQCLSIVRIQTALGLLDIWVASSLEQLWIMLLGM